MEAERKKRKDRSLSEDPRDHRYIIQQGEKLPEGLQKAAYRFVPLNSEILSSHALSDPRQAIDARINLVFEAVTPILIAGGEENEQNKTPIFIPGSSNGEKKYFIPSTTIRGYLRALMEITCSARLSYYTDQVFGLRDFTHYCYGAPKSNEHRPHPDYLSPVADERQVKMGWLFYDKGSANAETSGFKLYPAKEWGKFEYKQEPELANNQLSQSGWPTKEQGEKYEALGLAQKGKWPIYSSPYTFVQKSGNIYRYSSEGTEKNAKKGYLVFSGKAVKNNIKKYEYILFSDFIPTIEQATDSISIAAIEQFCQCHGQYRKKSETIIDSYELDPVPKALMRQVKAGVAMPVFYVGDPKAENFHFGFTRLFKIPHKYSVKDKLEKTQKPAPAFKADFVQSLFGYVEDQGEETLAQKGRVAFSQFMLDGNTPAQDPQKHQDIEAVLASPKPKFAPFYLQGCIKDWSHPNARLAGRKRYLARRYRKFC